MMAAFSATMLLDGRAALAAEEGITVTGSGTVKARPSEVVLQGTVSGEGELANDASVKYRDSKKKAIAAIENLKNPDLTIDTNGSDVHEAVDPQQQQRMMQGMGGGETTKTRVQVSEHLKLTLKNADKLEPDKLMDTVLKLIDTSRDAGIQIGPPPATNYYEMQMQAQNGGGNTLVMFKIPDTTQLQADACKQAVADAREKAQRIADLSGVKLGRVISVQDQGATSNIMAAMYFAMNGMNGNNGDRAVTKEAASETFGEIPVTVHLQVVFEIQK
jgi:uncharacterized protein YggE